MDRAKELQFAAAGMAKDGQIIKKDNTIVGKPLADFIRAMTDLDRKSRYSGWKSESELPETLKAKWVSIKVIETSVSDPIYKNGDS